MAGRITVVGGSPERGPGASVATSQPEISLLPVFSPIVVSANHRVTRDKRFVLANALSEPIIVSLPATPQALPVSVKKIDRTDNSVTIRVSGSGTIDGSLTKVLTDYNDAVMLVPLGDNWYGFPIGLSDVVAAIPQNLGPPGVDAPTSVSDPWLIPPLAPRKWITTMVLCSAFTPIAVGADIGEIPVPRIVGQPVTWNVQRINLRVNAAGGAPSVTVEKYTGTGAFAATTVGTVTLGGGAFYGETTTGFTTTQLKSDDIIRFNVGVLGTATGWAIEMELSEA